MWGMKSGKQENLKRKSKIPTLPTISVSLTTPRFEPCIPEGTDKRSNKLGQLHFMLTTSLQLVDIILLRPIELIVIGLEVCSKLNAHGQKVPGLV